MSKMSKLIGNPWTAEEDNLFLEHVSPYIRSHKCNIPWTKILQHMNQAVQDRALNCREFTVSLLKNHYSQYKRRESQHCRGQVATLSRAVAVSCVAAMSIKWTAEDDDLLTEALLLHVEENSERMPWSAVVASMNENARMRGLNRGVFTTCAVRRRYYTFPKRFHINVLVPIKEFSDVENRLFLEFMPFKLGSDGITWEYSTGEMNAVARWRGLICRVFTVRAFKHRYLIEVRLQSQREDQQAVAEPAATDVEVRLLWETFLAMDTGGDDFSWHKLAVEMNRVATESGLECREFNASNLEHLYTCIRAEEGDMEYDTGEEEEEEDEEKEKIKEEEEY